MKYTDMHVFNPADKEILMEYIEGPEGVPGGVAEVNKQVQVRVNRGIDGAVQDVISNFIEGTFFCLLMWIVFLFSAMLVGGDELRWVASCVLVALSQWAVYLVLGIGAVVELKTPRTTHFCCRSMGLVLCPGVRGGLRLIMMVAIAGVVVYFAGEEGSVLSTIWYSYLVMMVLSPSALLLRCLRVCLEHTCGKSARLSIGPLQCTKRELGSVILLQFFFGISFLCVTLDYLGSSMLLNYFCPRMQPKVGFGFGQ